MFVVGNIMEDLPDCCQTLGLSKDTYKVLYMTTVCCREYFEGLHDRLMPKIMFVVGDIYLGLNDYCQTPCLSQAAEKIFNLCLSPYSIRVTSVSIEVIRKKVR